MARQPRFQYPGAVYHVMAQCDWGSFEDKLLGLMDKAQAKIRTPGNHAGGALRAHIEKEAERIIAAVGAALGIPTVLDELMRLRNGDSNKRICAAMVKRNTAVGNAWLAKHLAMEHSAHVNRLVNRRRRNAKDLKILKKYENLLLKSKD